MRASGEIGLESCLAIAGKFYGWYSRESDPFRSSLPRRHRACVAPAVVHRHKTKPLGALGRLGALMRHRERILGSEAPVLPAPQILVCAADRGLKARRVSAFRSDVIWQMVQTFWLAVAP